MIYEYPSVRSPLRQGDIFVNVPSPRFNENALLVIDENNAGWQTTWVEFADHASEVEALITLKPVTAIVGTQDCDALRSPEITLFEIRPFREVEGKAGQTEKPKSWMHQIVRQSRINPKWFYLPSDEPVGFREKMAADFRLVTSVPRPILASLRRFRKGRLKKVPAEHFRERVGEFFRRLPYDPWYALDKEELAEYEKEERIAVPRFSWQR